MGLGKVGPAPLMDNASAQRTPAAAPSTTRRIPAIRFMDSLQKVDFAYVFEVWRLSVTVLLQFRESCLNRLAQFERRVNSRILGLYLHKNKGITGANR